MFFFKFESEFRAEIIRSDLVTIILIKVIANRGFKVQQEMDRHHGNELGDQRVADNR